MRAVSANVAEAPGAKSTAVAMLPLPDAAAQAFSAPGGTEHVQDAAESALGRLSVTAAPTTDDGPPFETTIVHVPSVPGTNVPACVFTTPRSAWAVRSVVSVASLSEVTGSVVPVGSVTAALLSSTPRACGAINAEIVNVAVAPGARSSSVSMVAVVPDPTEQSLKAPNTAHVQDTLVSDVGIASTSRASATPEGPLLVTVIV